VAVIVDVGVGDDDGEVCADMLVSVGFGDDDGELCVDVLVVVGFGDETWEEVGANTLIVCERVEDVDVGAGCTMELISGSTERRDERSTESPSDVTAVLEVLLSGSKEARRDARRGTGPSPSEEAAALGSDVIWEVWE
jgi:hypothetical protein